MAKQDGEAQGAPRAIQSQGEDAARAYAVGEVAPRPLHPTLEMERVHIEDPRRVPPPRGDARRGTGARNPEQRAPLADGGAPSVTMPERLPVTRRQPIVIDSELLAQWHGERGGRREGGEAAGAEAAGADGAGADTAGAEAAGAEAAGADTAGADTARNEETESGAEAGAAGGGAAGAEAAGANVAGANVAGANVAGANVAASDTTGTGAAGGVPRLADVAAARRVARRTGRRRATWVMAAGIVIAMGSAALRTETVVSDGKGAVAAATGEGARVEGAVPVVPAAPGAREGAPAGPEVAGAAAPVEASAGTPADLETAMRAAREEIRPAAPRGAEGSTRTAPRVQGPHGAARAVQESRPRGQAAPEDAAPRPSASASASAPARKAPASPRVTPEERRVESASLPSPPSPYDKPIFD